jgi:hypothetical protein
MEKEARSRLADELIAEAAAKWEDTPTSFKIIEDGTIYFTFVLTDESGSSTMRYNPKDAVERIIEDVERQIHPSVTITRDSSLHSNAYSRLLTLLGIAENFFTDCLSFLPRLTATVHSAHTYHVFGDEQKKQEVIAHTAEEIKSTIEQRLGGRKRGLGKQPKTGKVPTETSILMAADLAEDAGSVPAKEAATARQLAHWLGGVSQSAARAALRTWWKNQGYENWENALADLKQKRLER